MESQIVAVLESALFPMSAKRIAEELHEETRLAMVKRILAKLAKSGKAVVKKVKAYHHAYNPHFGGTIYAAHMENKYSATR